MRLVAVGLFHSWVHTTSCRILPVHFYPKDTLNLGLTDSIPCVPNVAGLVAWRLSPHEEAVGTVAASLGLVSPALLGLQHNENVALVLPWAGVQVLAEKC